MKLQDILDEKKPPEGGLIALRKRIRAEEKQRGNRVGRLRWGVAVLVFLFALSGFMTLLQREAADGGPWSNEFLLGGQSPPADGSWLKPESGQTAFVELKREGDVAVYYMVDLKSNSTVTR